MSKLLRAALALVCMTLVTTTLSAQGGMDYTSTDLKAVGVKNGGNMQVTWKWSASSSSTVEVEVFKYLGADQNGQPILGASLWKQNPSQTGTSGSNPTNPPPTPKGTPGVQYISRIQLSRGGSVIQTSHSVAIFAP